MVDHLRWQVQGIPTCLDVCHCGSSSGRVFSHLSGVENDVLVGPIRGLGDLEYKEGNNLGVSCWFDAR